MLTRDASLLWNNLRGLICVYKPVETKVGRVRKTIINKLCEDLNQLDVRPPTDHVKILGDPTKKLKVVVEENLADHPMVTGPRYQNDDVICSWANYLGYNTSGVLLLSIKNGKITKDIRENRPTRAYRIKGMFGTATDTFFKDGTLVERTTHQHVKQRNMDRLLSSMQMSHQQQMFKLCGVDIQSQTAYELACQGPIRPVNSKVPLLYGIKCVEFKNPEFTIEVQCINEYEKYLVTLIHEIGMKLNSSAHCTSVQCIRHSYFTLDNALLKKHWNLQNIVTNMGHCHQILQENDNILRQKHVALQK